MNNMEKKTGLIAGISLLIMALAAGFSYGFVQNQLFTESAALTKQSILENHSLFYAGLAGWVVILITDLVVSLAIYWFFRRTLKAISLLTASVRMVYTVILGIAVFQLFRIIPALSADREAADIISYFAAFEKTWSAGLIIFGIHLVGLGYLSVKSQNVPGWLGYLLVLAGVSYLFIHGSKQFTLLSAHVITSAENILAVPMSLSEILLAIWLIYKGLKKIKPQVN